MTINIKEAIRAGQVLKAIKDEKAARQAEITRQVNEVIEQKRIQKMRDEVDAELAKLEQKIIDTVSYGSTKVNLHIQPGRVIKNNPYTAPEEIPESWLYAIEQCKLMGIKAQILHDRYEDNDYNSECSGGNSWYVHFIYLGINLIDYKL